MSRLLTGLVFCFSAFSMVSAASAMEWLRSIPPGVETKLHEYWKEEISCPLKKLDPFILEDLQNYHVVLVPGIFNEASPTLTHYFETAKETIENDLGMSAEIRKYSSRQPIPFNSDLLQNEIREIHRQINSDSSIKKKIILIGHSKGGAESLFAILGYPDLILNDVVDKVILIQAAIQGTLLLKPERVWKPIDLIKNLPVVGGGLLACDPSQAKANLEVIFEKFNQHIELNYGHLGPEHTSTLRKKISESIYYVRGYDEPENLLSWTHLSQWWCGNHLTEDGPNDGILRLEDQMDPRIGIDLGVVKAEHGALVLTNRLKPLTELIGYPHELTPAEQKAFYRTILQRVYSEVKKARSQSPTSVDEEPSLPKNSPE